MLVRIKGIVEEILMTDGRSKQDRPWQKKTYVIRDNSYSKEEFNKVVHVNDFGKLDPSAFEPIFTFRSNFVVGEEVDLACYLETNDYGFTNVDYCKPYEDISKPKDNVIRPDKVEAEAEPEPEQVEMQKEDNTSLPF